MLRLTPPGHMKIEQAQNFEFCFGGAEANTAVLLARLGLKSAFVTKLPDNPIGRACLNKLRENQVETKHIIMDNSNKARLGIYFCEQGASQRPSRVFYDRRNSCFALMGAEDAPHWESVLKTASWLHFTGITPALGEGPRISLKEACQTARRLKIPVSCDLNYRASLWDGVSARETMEEYMPFVSLLIANCGSAKDVFNIGGGVDAPPDVQNTLRIARTISEKYNIPRVAMTMRTVKSASRNLWQGFYLDNGRPYFSREYEMEIIERVGGGDCFSAGLIFGLSKGWNGEKCVQFAAAASCLKHSVPGDFPILDMEEIERLADYENMLINR